MKRRPFLPAAAACLAGALTLTSCASVQTGAGAKAQTASRPDVIPPSPTGYHALYMDTANIVLYGKVEVLDESFLKLTDVHYIRTNIDQQKKEVSNQVVKRGAEWHRPESTIVNRSHIIFIEPVAEDSRIMALIRDLRVQEQGAK
jgi:hypothetical protein